VNVGGGCWDYLGFGGVEFDNIAFDNARLDDGEFGDVGLTSDDGGLDDKFGDDPIPFLMLPLTL
jgi:hypothetical protein